jgi:hypothetical protein
LIPIRIDISDIANEFSQVNEKDLSTTVLSAAVSDLRAKIGEKASRELKSSKSDFLSSIKVEVFSHHYAEVSLVGKLANQVESGTSAFDIKTGLLNSSKVKISKDGSKYIDVPFTQGTPAANPSNFSSIMPNPVYGAAKKLKPKESLKNVPSPYDIPKSRAAIKDSNGLLFPAYKHKVSIFDRIQRTQISGQKIGKYVSFRRVSENSPDNAFIHKGIKAKNIFSTVEKSFDPSFAIDEAVDNYLNSLGL